MCLFSLRRWVLPLLALALAPAGLRARADVTVDSGSVVVTVRAPDGRPLRGQALKVYPADPGPWSPATQAPPTDAQGRLTVRLPAGLQRLHVIAPGVGFGSTGTVVVRPDQTRTIPMPPLAPFARISGTVAPGLLRPGETVQVQGVEGGPAWAVAPAKVGPHGDFQLADVFPGANGLTLIGSPQNNVYVSVQVMPGEAHSGVVFAPSPQVPFVPVTPAPSVTETVTIRGLVTDDRGRPVAGAEVSAAVPKPTPPGSQSGFFNSLFGPPHLILTARTGDDGHYVIPSAIVYPATTDIPVSAVFVGYPPAVGEAQRVAGSGDDLRSDLVLSTQHTAVTVRVRRGGLPAPGVTVSLTEHAGAPTAAQGWMTRTPYWGDTNGFGLASQVSFTNLTATTGADGAARFVDLPPGLWVAQATQGRYPDVQSSGAQDVTVQLGVGAACDLTLPVTTPADLSLQLSTPQGSPASGAAVGDPGVEVQDTLLAGPGSGSGTWLTPDAQGEALESGAFTAPGLWLVSIQYRDFQPSPPNWYPETPEPYYDASALVAVSPGLTPPGTLALRAARLGPGSIRAHLEDTQGRPAHGTIIITDFAGRVDYAASTDAHGVVIFPEMLSGKYTLLGDLAGQPAPVTLSHNGDRGPLPTDAALSGQTQIAPLAVTVGADQEAQVVLRAQPVGYVRGNFQAALPSGGDYELFPTSSPGINVTVAGGQVDAQTGRFIYGPLPPGPLSQPVFLSKPGAPFTRVAMVTANVVAGRVVQAAVTPAPPYPDTDATPAQAEPVSGTVLFSDGQTPAWNAQCVLCRPSPDPAFRATLIPQEPTDVLGRLPGVASSISYSFSSDAPVSPPSGSDPDGPVLVAWMPGLTGAALMPYARGQSARIVLPAPLAVSGRITVGGRPVTTPDSTFHIRAAYQGRGALNDLLSRDATAQPDGSFTLWGLTPGTYLVQAARDGIWLSRTQTLVVGDGPPPALTLDIGPPGAPVVLPLADADGRPLPGRAATLDWPPGPLADTLWPKALTSDGAGDLHLDGLTAGPHTVRPDGRPAMTFTVPPAPPIDSVMGRTP